MLVYIWIYMSIFTATQFCSERAPQQVEVCGLFITITPLTSQVTYDAEGFCEKNRDVLFKDCIELMQGSSW